MADKLNAPPPNANHGNPPGNPPALPMGPGHASPDVKFTISNGAVTGMAVVAGTHTINVGLPGNATFSVASGKVVETLKSGTATETRTYTVDAKDATLYHLATDATVNDTTAAGARTYKFAVANGKVTSITEGVSTSRTHTVDVSKLPGTSFAVSGSTITETSVHGNAVETVKFVTTDGTTYKLASDTLSFVAAGTATTLLSVEPQDRMSFTFNGNTVTNATHVLPDGTAATGAAHPATAAHPAPVYTKLAAGYVLETVTIGTNSHYEVFHDGNGDGIYTAVAHGTGTTVDLVGLQAQISPVINALL